MDYQEKLKEQKLWTEYLNERYCRADEVTGNRPCDNGVLCDSCQTISAQEGFESFKKRKQGNK